MPTGDGSTEELAGFLKDMTGGEEIALDNFDEGIDVLVEEVARESPKVRGILHIFVAIRRQHCLCITHIFKRRSYAE